MMQSFTLLSVINVSVFMSRPQKAAVGNIQATHPLQLVHLNYLTIEATEGGKDVHVFVITDHFMRYAQVLVTSLQTAKCTILTIHKQMGNMNILVIH